MAVTVDPAVFVKARDVIHERGWAQLELETESRAVCVRGALNVALFGDPLFVVDPHERGEIAAPYVHVLADVLRADPLDEVEQVTVWKIAAPYVHVLADVLRADPLDEVEQVTTWNDTAYRTVGEVLDLLDRAEQAAKEQSS